MFKNINDIISLFSTELRYLKPFNTDTTRDREAYYIEDKDITIVKYSKNGIRVYFDRISDFDNLPCRFKYVQYFNDEHKQEGKIEEV